MLATLKTAFGRHKWRLLLLAGTSGASAFLEALSLATLVPLLQAIASEDGLFRTNLRFLNRPMVFGVKELLAACSLAILGRAILQLLCGLLGARLTAVYEAERRGELLDAFLGAAWGTQAREKGGRLQLLMLENVARGTTALRSIVTGIIAGCNFLILLAAAFFIDAGAALCIAAVAAILFLATRPLSSFARRLSDRRAQLNTMLVGEVNQSVRVVREIRVFNAADSLKAVVRSIAKQVRRSHLLAQFSHSALPALYQNTAGLIVVGGLGVVYFTGGGKLAALSTVALLLIRTLGYSQTFQAIHHVVTEAVPYLDQMAEVETTYRSSAVPDRGGLLKGIERLSFHDVCFAYNPPALTLKHLTFEIPRGEVVGVAGPSGSGKSTLVQLFLRLRRPTAGEILVNGCPLDDFSLSSWFDRVAYVPQEPQLLTASIAENIAFYRPQATRERIERSARMAGIHEEIAALPLGYESDAGEAGGSLSGGQRQRICIARALLGEPDFVIFDEPTSSLDVHSEERIQETLLSLKGKVTLFIVAHRLSTLSICDRIMVLKEGQIASFATGEVLARTDPYYSDALRLARKGAS